MEIQERQNKLFLDAFFGSRSKKFITCFVCVFLLGILFYFEKTKRIAPYGTIFYKMGLNCENTCSQNQQIQYFRKAIFHNPMLSGAYYQLALVYEHRKEYDQSAQYFRKVTQVDTDSALAFYKVGRQYYAEGDYERALRYFLHALGKSKGFPEDIHYYLAKIYDQKQDYERAFYFYVNAVYSSVGRAKELYPRIVELYYLRNHGGQVESEVSRLRKIGRSEWADILEQSHKAYLTFKSF